MTSDKGLSIATMHRICKKAGAERVSESAARELARVLEEIGLKIGKEALDFTMRARFPTELSQLHDNLRKTSDETGTHTIH